MNSIVIPIYKNGEKRIFDHWVHLNPPHLRWSFRFFGDFRPFQRNFYIFINAGLEPKLFEIKSSTQQQSCKAHKIGQFCHQGWPFICLCSKVRDRARTAFKLAPKWEKAANRRFCKFDSIQPYPTQRQLNWSTLMFIKSSFLGYPTCLLSALVVWWSTTPWTARTTRRRRPGRLLALGCISYFSWNFFN